ncbi:MAG: hypothetical protein LBD01_02045 [Puniceicoccales bacterium]|jgi:hypothetical protein|nr:hypothetical protein [Puniceicoccales bacterium]
MPTHEQSALGHYNSELPAVSPGSQTGKTYLPGKTSATEKNDTTEKASDPEKIVAPEKSNRAFHGGISGSAIYVFDSGIDLQNHTGWGGVIEFFLEHRRPWETMSFRMSTDFLMFSTEANTRRNGMRFNETIDAGQIHLNLGGSFCYGQFDFGLDAGFGGGITRTANTYYNTPGSETTLDASLQMMLRVTWKPTDWCSAFVGYRGFWLVPLGSRYPDPLERLEHKSRGEPTSYPTLSFQCIEAGLSLRF